MSDKPSEEIQDQSQIRQSLVATAVHFLLNPSVIGKPTEQKTAFLRKKGLTEVEIALAYERAENESKSKPIQGSNVVSSPAVIPPPVPVYRPPVSFWSRLSRFSSSVIILGVALFGAHYIYKKYIEPLIFGGVSDDRAQKLEVQLQEMINALSHLQTKISDLEENVKFQKAHVDMLVHKGMNDNHPIHLALKEMKTDISSVKSLLLSRNQFPALPKVTSPSIPQWQLPFNENESATTKLNSETTEIQHLDESSSAAKPSADASSEDSDSVELINGPGKADENSKLESVKNENSEGLNDSLPVW